MDVMLSERGRLSWLLWWRLLALLLKLLWRLLLLWRCVLLPVSALGVRLSSCVLC